jgi:flagellar biosynthesis protein FliQ
MERWHKKRFYITIIALFVFLCFTCSLAEAYLSERKIMSMGGRALYMIFLLSAPMLFAALGLGLIISILQAVTSVQEQTLGFVPKLLITFVMLMVFGPWISATMINFTAEVWKEIEFIGKN